MRSVCVFCGSSRGADPAYVEAAAAFGREAGRRGIDLVYGGGTLGLMGVLADAALAAGGHVTGVIPRLLMEREVGHQGVTRLHVVDTMHERKAKMAALAEAFAILPGGIGTMEEFFEIWSWAQLGYHAKPFGVLEVKDYWSGLLAFLDRMVAEGFTNQRSRSLIHVATDPAGLLDALAANAPAPSQRQVDVA